MRSIGGSVPNWFFIDIDARFEQFMRTESSLVIHRLVFLNPVTEVRVFQRFSLCPFDFRENGKRSRTQFSPARIVIEVGARQALAEYVDNSDANQSPVFPVLKFPSETVRPADERFIVVLERRCVVGPVPPRRHVSMVKIEQCDVFVGNVRLRHEDLNVLISSKSFPLTLRRAELVQNDAERPAFLARLALRPEDVVPETPPASFKQLFERFCIEPCRNAVLKLSRFFRKVRTWRRLCDKPNQVIRLFVVHAVSWRVGGR